MSAPLILALLAVGLSLPAADVAEDLLPPVRLQAAGKPIDTEFGHAAPFIADFDGDGIRDLLVGPMGEGILWVYRNIGTDRTPILAAGVQLVPPGKATQGTNTSKELEPRRGVRAKICVIDYNSDGRSDLLVGDFASHRRPDPTPQEKEKQARARKELAEVMEQYRKLVCPKAVKDKVEKEKVEKEIQALKKQRKELLKVAVPRDYEHHGWVWLYERKPSKR